MKQKLNAGQLVHKLLAALGAELDEGASDRDLMEAAVAKIRELKSSGSQREINPLIPGGRTKIDNVMYMSLDAMHQRNTALRESLARIPVAVSATPAEAEQIANTLAGMVGGRPQSQQKDAALSLAARSALTAEDRAVNALKDKLGMRVPEELQ